MVPNAATTTLQDDLQCLASYGSAECYFEYKRSSDSVYSTSGSGTRSSTGLYDVDIATTTDTTYDFRAVAEAPDGTTVRGGVLPFQTGDGTSEQPDSSPVARDASAGDSPASGTASDFRAVAEFSDGSVRRGDVLTFRTPEDDGFGGSE